MHHTAVAAGPAASSPPRGASKVPIDKELWLLYLGLIRGLRRRYFKAAGIGCRCGQPAHLKGAKCREEDWASCRCKQGSVLFTTHHRDRGCQPWSDCSQSEAKWTCGNPTDLILGMVGSGAQEMAPWGLGILMLTKCEDDCPQNSLKLSLTLRSRIPQSRQWGVYFLFSFSYFQIFL